MSWPCPSCGANCRTPESLHLHVKRCRAMSVEEIATLISGHQDPFVPFPLGAMIHKSTVEGVAKAIHAAHIAKLRGRKS